MPEFNEGKDEEQTEEETAKPLFGWLPENCVALADGGILSKKIRNENKTTTNSCNLSLMNRI